MNLYADSDADGMIDDVNGDGVVTLADADNHPLDNFPGPEDIDRTGNGVFDGGDAISIVHADSWDDAPPTGCVNPADNNATPIAPFVDCAEIIPVWNQVRPGDALRWRVRLLLLRPRGVDSGTPRWMGFRWERTSSR